MVSEDGLDGLRGIFAAGLDGVFCLLAAVLKTLRDLPMSSDLFTCFLRLDSAVIRTVDVRCLWWAPRRVTCRSSP